MTVMGNTDHKMSDEAYLKLKKVAEICEVTDEQLSALIKEIQKICEWPHINVDQAAGSMKKAIKKLDASN